MSINKSGISLIVLVITIIVMIILAASVVLTLSNTGIINKANEAVNKTNLKEVEQLAALTWSEEFMDGKRGDTLKNAVLEKLKDYTDEYVIEVDDKGVSVVPKEQYSKKLASELTVGDLVYYVDANNNKIECVVLYDKEYSEKNSKEYGIQIMPTSQLDTAYFLAGPEDGHESSYCEEGCDQSGNICDGAYEIAEAYNNFENTVKEKCAAHINLSYSPTGGIRSIGEGTYLDEDILQKELTGYESLCCFAPLTHYTVEPIEVDEYTTIDDYRYYVRELGDTQVLQEIPGWRLVMSEAYLYTYPYHYTISGYVMPIFTLIEDLKITSGDGVTEPFTLEAKSN